MSMELVDVIFWTGTAVFAVLGIIGATAIAMASGNLLSMPPDTEPCHCHCHCHDEQ